MKKNIISLIICFCLALSGCSSSREAPQVVTTSYSLEFIVEHIAPELKVTNLIDNQIEPHDFEPSFHQTSDILESNLVFVVGNGYQPAVEKIARKRPRVFWVFDRSKGIRSTPDVNDPHFWLDPVEYISVVTRATNFLIQNNPKRKEQYRKNSNNLIKQLDELNLEYETGLTQCRTRVFITSHNAFSKLANRYSLANESLMGVSPEGDISAKRKVQLKETIKREQIKTIFYEQNVSNKPIKTLAKEMNIKATIIYSIETISQEQRQKNEDYFSLMRDNLVNLRSAMNCVDSL